MTANISNFEDKFYHGLPLVALIFFILWIPPRAAASAIGNLNDKSITDKTTPVRLPFIQNMGQVKNKGVRFYAETGGGHLLINDKGLLVYSLILVLFIPA